MEARDGTRRAGGVNRAPKILPFGTSCSPTVARENSQNVKPSRLAPHRVNRLP